MTFKFIAAHVSVLTFATESVLEERLHLNSTIPAKLQFNRRVFSILIQHGSCISYVDNIVIEKDEYNIPLNSHGN